MTGSALAVAWCLVALIAMSSAALAESTCGGVVISDVIESPSGELTAVGERCYERAPGTPYYFDAPRRRRPGSIEVSPPVDSPASITRFEASTIEAMGAMNIMDVATPFPAGQGEADFQPE